MDFLGDGKDQGCASLFIRKLHLTFHNNGDVVSLVLIRAQVRPLPVHVCGEFITALRRRRFVAIAVNFATGIQPFERKLMMSSALQVRKC
jgi:hypothetical protein